MNSTSLQCLTNGIKIKFFANIFGAIKEGYKDVHFLKRSLEDITESNITTCLLISTMRFSCVDSLYQYIKTVYEPLLVFEHSNIQNINSQIKKHWLALWNLVLALYSKRDLLARQLKTRRILRVFFLQQMKSSFGVTSKRWTLKTRLMRSWGKRQRT